jgi:hypothetical protein
MKTLVLIASIGLGSAMGAAHAAETKQQQTKMAECNKEASGKKGDERKAFMKSCLSAKKESTQPAR